MASVTRFIARVSASDEGVQDLDHAAEKIWWAWNSWALTAQGVYPVPVSGTVNVPPGSPVTESVAVLGPSLVGANAK